jgi:hypothetical protein
MMSRVQKGLVAGFAATVVVSILEVINIVAGPWVTPYPDMLAYMVGMEGNHILGWVGHVLIGTVVLGGLFGLVYPKLPTDTPETKGIAFAVAAFCFLVVGLLMFGKPQMFSGADGGFTVAWILVSNAIFGFVMGSVYARLAERERRAARVMAGSVPAH